MHYIYMCCLYSLLFCREGWCYFFIFFMTRFLMSARNVFAVPTVRDDKCLLVNLVLSADCVDFMKENNFLDIGGAKHVFHFLQTFKGLRNVKVGMKRIQVSTLQDYLLWVSNLLAFPAAPFEKLLLSRQHQIWMEQRITQNWVRKVINQKNSFNKDTKWFSYLANLSSDLALAFFSVYCSYEKEQIYPVTAVTSIR